MSEVFEGYERQYCELSANLSRKCTSATALDGERKKQKLAEIKTGVEDAEALIRKMDLEARSLQPNVKAVLLAKLREYKSDLNNLKTEVKRISSGNSYASGRDDLLESGMADAMTNALIHLYASKGLPTVACRVFYEAESRDVVSWSGLVVAHVRAGELDNAREVFNAMPQKDVVSWTVMVSGYAQGKRSEEALDLFSKMRVDGVRPDEVTMVSVISACTNLGDLRTGLGVHRYIDENGFGWMVSLSNALIDMYAKCGCMDMAWEVFNNLSRKSLITWNSMISACANHGVAEDALELFEFMLNSGVRPDGITFLAVLVAYTHKGWVDEGYRVFESMQREYGIVAGVEHYGCIVDMFGRAGRLEEAYQLIVNMPIPSNDKVWGALLASSKIYDDVDMGEKVLKKLIELKPDEGGYYILLRDIYDASGRTAEALEIRKIMEANGARKTPGSSWVGE